MVNDWKNKLYFGDNLDVMEELPNELVDLIYLDPPFNSKATYNVLFHEHDGTNSAAQITAFEDTWHWDLNAEETYRDLVLNSASSLRNLIEALRGFLGQSDMMAYLTMMAVRLLEMHRLLKPSGSIYLHCDPTASHYLKVLMDTVFGSTNFKNEIIWKRSQPKGHTSIRFSNSHDVILLYSKSDKASFQPQYRPHDPDYIEKFYRFVEPETGRRYRLGDLTNPNKNRPNLTYEFPPGSGIVRVWRWTKDRMTKAWDDGIIVMPKDGGVAQSKRYLDEMEGSSVTDIWDDIEHLHGTQKELLGYPTQKPESLLERIIEASSKKGDLILDPFCGCGTTITVAERMHRRWIGIDITHIAITLMKNRLEDTFGPELAPYEIIGLPADIESAKALALENRHQFEIWAISLVDARPFQEKRGTDTGIDGDHVFFDDHTGKAKRVVVQVKSGKVGSSQIRDLKGVLDRDKASIGAFITLNPPTRDMIKEATSAGFYESPFDKSHYPRMQILTVEGLLNGTERLEYPRSQDTWNIRSKSAFKRATRRSKDTQEQQGLFEH